MTAGLPPAPPHRPASRLERRLDGYWRLEGLNVLLVPAIGLVLTWPPSGVGALALLPTLGANALLLLAGAAYWRAVLKGLQGDPAPMAVLLPCLDRTERPLALLLVAAGVAATVAAALDGWTATVLVALGGALLAMLEYVNYYRVQLQHFDNAADFKRLLRGRGWRAAHLGRDLAAYRRSR